MSTFILLAIYWSIMILCYFLASKLRNLKEKFAFVETLMNIAIVMMVFVMGLRMGANKEITSSLATIGLQSVVISILVIGGSVICVTITRKLIGLNKFGVTDKIYDEEQKEVNAESEEQLQNLSDAKPDKAEMQDLSGLKMTLTILIFTVIGMITGYMLIPVLFNDVNAFQEMSADWLVAGLCMLLGFVGFNMGLSGEIAESIKNVSFKAVLVPLSAVIGSLIGGMLYGLISPLSVGESVAVSAGFGWYTLAPGLISDAGFQIAGAISFMHNVIREVFGIIIIPYAAKKIGYLECTAIPGVAAMDICLPIVARSTRAEVVIYSFIVGLLMCLAVPIVVPIAIGLA